MISGREALDRLREGNARFTANLRESDDVVVHGRRHELSAGQEPIAIILGCSDARVPAEIVFDQGLGDLFVIRVAGNIVAPSQVASVEFAAEAFATRLVVVLGHSRCGAIAATIEELRTPPSQRTHKLHAIVDRVRPSVQAFMGTDVAKDYDLLARRATRANISASADHLRHGSATLEQLIRDNGLVIVGAEYSVETGAVEFFDGVPPGTAR